MPPPSAKRPFGVDAIARLPTTSESCSSSEPGPQVSIPPPRASLATPAATLLLTVVRSSVSRPQLSIPAPRAIANGHGPAGHGGPNGSAVVGTARLPLMMLSLTVTVAPRLNPAAGLTLSPPPAANTPLTPTKACDSPLEVVTPPLIVTPVITTVGWFAARKSPTLTTGPPPRIVVASAPAPTSLTLLVIASGPRYVPAPTLTTSPFRALESADWIVAAHPAPSP